MTIDTPEFDAAIAGLTWQELEAAALRAALRRHGGNKRSAAKAMRISERTMQRKMPGAYRVVNENLVKYPAPSEIFPAPSAGVTIPC